MVNCELCNKSGEDLSLREATHKELGKKWVCKSCWTDLYMKNEMISGSTDGGVAGCAMGCPNCRSR